MVASVVLPMASVPVSVLPRFKQLKLPLELGAHFDPILNEVMDYSHAFTSMLSQHTMG